MIEVLKNLKHKDEDPNEWDSVKPTLRVLAYELIDYCKIKNLPLVITGIIFEPTSASKTVIHRDGRAFDVSVQGWSLKQILDCESYFNEKFSKRFGAVGKETGKAKACFYESPDYNGRGTGPHLHFQVRPI